MSISAELDEPTPRTDLRTAAPELRDALKELGVKARERARAAGIDPLLVQLVEIRASQINGCAYCLDKHTREALRAGETPERLAVLSVWRDTARFSRRERAALLLTEAVTQISDGQVSEEVYRAVAGVLSSEEIVAVTWLVVAINSWNRIAISSRSRVGRVD